MSFAHMHAPRFEAVITTLTRHQAARSFTPPFSPWSPVRRRSLEAGWWWSESRVFNVGCGRTSTQRGWEGDTRGWHKLVRWCRNIGKAWQLVRTNHTFCHPLQRWQQSDLRLWSECSSNEQNGPGSVCVWPENRSAFFFKLNADWHWWRVKEWTVKVKTSKTSWNQQNGQ